MQKSFHENDINKKVKEVNYLLKRYGRINNLTIEDILQDAKKNGIKEKWYSDFQANCNKYNFL